MTTFKSSSYDKGMVEVALNHTNFDSQDDALFVKVADKLGVWDANSVYSTLSLADAKKLAAHINALVKEFESYKPTPPTRRKFVEALPVGTVFSTKLHSYSDRQQWLRVDAGAYRLNGPLKGDTDNLGYFSKYETKVDDVIIDYKPEEAK